jgi:hypothetical protein
MDRSIWIGFDPREVEAFEIARRSVRANTIGVPISPLDLPELRRFGLYTRPTSRKDGVLWDDISQAPMSTEFAISRFLTPIMAGGGHALFMDCDIFARRSLEPLFAQCEADPSKAVWCVKHDYTPKNGTKMDGQIQTQYSRKNWSSVIVFNVEHPSNAKLTVDLINEVPGRDLHRFCWLEDHEIGELHPKWNFLVGITDESIDPVLVHHTNGTPAMEGYENEPFADEWRHWRRKWLSETRFVGVRPSLMERLTEKGVNDAAYLA